jgi:hypothetical protein
MIFHFIIVHEELTVTTSLCDIEPLDLQMLRFEVGRFPA